MLRPEQRAALIAELCDKAYDGLDEVAAYSLLHHADWVGEGRQAERQHSRLEMVKVPTSLGDDEKPLPGLPNVIDRSEFGELFSAARQS